MMLMKKFLVDDFVKLTTHFSIVILLSEFPSCCLCCCVCRRRRRRFYFGYCLYLITFCLLLVYNI